MMVHHVTVFTEAVILHMEQAVLCIGASNPHIMLRYILPNAMAAIIVLSTICSVHLACKEKGN